MGFGRDELFGVKYWGGLLDLQGELRGAGYETYTAAVGPLASNWDRACELFASIKGGRTDYGRVHSQTHGHSRYGRSYPGLYPDWGETDLATGGTDADVPEQPGKAEATARSVRRIHLLGHSMGGQTARTLVQLLEEGSAAEIAGTPPEELSPLFAGGKAGAEAWVASVTTLTTPHDGSSLAYRVDLSGRVLRELFALAAFLTESSGEPYFDFKLEQWGLGRRPAEPLAAYRERVLGHELWRGSRDTALWDASPEGARELNRWVRARPAVYYFSWAAEETFTDPLTGREVPEPGMVPILASASVFIGSFLRQGPDCKEQGLVCIDRSWWQNDGMVNTISMDGPSLDSADRIVPFSGVPQRGVWNYMGLIGSFDHLNVIGLPPWSLEKPRGYAGLREWYLAMAALVASLTP